MKNNQNKGLTVSNEAIAKAGLGDEIAVIGTEGAIVIANAKMTAMELIKTIDSLAEITQGYLAILAKNCGECDDCGHCEELDFEGSSMLSWRKMARLFILSLPNMTTTSPMCRLTCFRYLLIMASASESLTLFW